MFASVVMVLAAMGLVVTVRYVVALLRGKGSAGSAATFLCIVRPAASRAAARDRWPLRRSRGAWIHDVLILSRGLMFPRVVALAVRMPEDTLRDARHGEVRRLGVHVLVIVLRLDDGSLVEVAARSRDRSQLVGPFLAAAIPGLPQGRRELPKSGH